MLRVVKDASLQIGEGGFVCPGNKVPESLCNEHASFGLPSEWRVTDDYAYSRPLCEDCARKLHLIW